MWISAGQIKTELFGGVSLARSHSASCLKQRPVYANISSTFPTGTPNKFSTYKHLSTGRQQLPVRTLHTILHFLHHMNMTRREYHSVKHAANKKRTTRKALSGIFTKPRDCSKNLAHDFWRTYRHIFWTLTQITLIRKRHRVSYFPNPHLLTTLTVRLSVFFL